MPRLLLVAALATLFTLPVAAQSVAAHHGGTATSTTAAAIDAALVGQWTLAEVEEADALAAMEAEVTAMTCVFGTDGEATVGLTVEQDGHAYERSRSFHFAAAEGRLLTDGETAALYEIVGTDELRLTMPDGFVARLRRADS